MENSPIVTRIEDTQSFEALRNEWAELLFKSDEKDVFLTWEWLFAWWKNLGQGSDNRLWLLTVRDNNELIGIAPFMLNKKRKAFITLRRLENLGNPECDISGIISINPQKTVNAVLKYLAQHAREWDVLELNELRLSGEATQCLINELSESQFKFIQSVDNHYFIPITGQWEDYYNSLSKNLKHNLKRRRKRTEEMGSITYEIFSGGTLTWDIFQKMFQLNERGNFPDLYKPAASASFHKDLFEHMRDKGWLQIEMLSIAGKPAAFQYGFAFDGRYEDWRGGIDKEYEILAPGKLLMMLSLEHRFKSGFRESDFLRGIYSYKLDWLPSPREFICLQVFNPRRFPSKIAYQWARSSKARSSQPDQTT
jgi:CelD/BcsL family acetyltransferase involved in cellulose biosynthesis